MSLPPGSGLRQAVITKAIMQISMKSFFNRFLMMILACTTTVYASGQNPMTLRDCMAYAISNSTKMRIQQAETGDAQIARRSAILRAFTPGISASTYAYYNFGRSIDPETNTYVTETSFHNGYSLSAGMTLFDGFSAVNNLKISKTALAIGQTQEKQVSPYGRLNEDVHREGIHASTKERNDS